MLRYNPDLSSLLTITPLPGSPGPAALSEVSAQRDPQNESHFTLQSLAGPTYPSEQYDGSCHVYENSRKLVGSAAKVHQLETSASLP